MVPVQAKRESGLGNPLNKEPQNVPLAASKPNTDMDISEPAGQGVKRSKGPADDSARLERDAAAQAAETRGVKRHGEEVDDSARMDREATDMGALAEQSRREDRGAVTASLATHPGPRKGEDDAKGDTQWHDVGSGEFHKTFHAATRLVTTSRGGPAVQDVHRRVIRSLSTGKVIDDCVVDDTPDKLLNRHLRVPDDIRVELIMKNAVKAFNFDRDGIDVAEVYSQPRINAEAAVRSYKAAALKPGWSLDLTRDDPTTGTPWDLSKPEVRERVRKMVRETKPFVVIGSPPCTMFCPLQSLGKGKRNEAEFQR